ncbi:MAG TPA: hypothetical protein P5511_00245 [Candidatus Goldiibacteriota bacterium]|nr:hypothetical protein [Candidatus Goldiibacteriota bacterium]
MGNTAIKKDFVDSFSYPSKNPRPLGKEPLSVPRDPLITDFSAFAGRPFKPSSFKYALYLTAFDVRDYGADIKKFIKIFSPLSLSRVYLETYRDGYRADKSVLTSAQKALEKSGISVFGGITTTHFSDKCGFNSWYSASSCYTEAAARKKLRDEFSFCAGLFDNIIIDDWFFTVCECPECVKAKKKKTWAEYRGKLMADVSKKYAIEPAKKTNKKVKLILKLPHWYEKFYSSGYDLEKLIPLYDEIAVGTETRDPATTRFMPVHGALLFNYIARLAPGKVKKAWFDIYNCNKEIYTEQAYQSVLGGAEELILFCGGILPQPLMRPLVEEMIAATPKIDRLSGFKGLFKAPIIRETNAEDTVKLEQYFLMAGIPAYITPETGLKEKFVVLTGQSCGPKQCAQLFNGMLKAGKDMLLTAEFASMAGRAFNVRKMPQQVKIETIKYNSREENVDSRAYVGYDIRDGREICLSNGAYPLLSYFKIKNSSIWVMDVPDVKSEITTHDGGRINEGLRFLLRSRGFVEAIKAPFSGYVNVNLYDRVKTMYKHKL